MTYTDLQGPGKKQSATSEMMVVVGRSTNTAPVFKDSEGMEITAAAITREIAENSAAGTAVGKPVGATDSEGDVLTYTLSGTDDDSSFSIDWGTGQIRVGDGTELDFETMPSYTVMVTATDPKFTATDSDTITVTINVTNESERPKLTGMDSVKHMENTLIATAVTTYEATDDEDGAEMRPALTLAGTDASAFSLTDTSAAAGNATDGTYELAFKTVPNFEKPADAGKNNVYNITVCGH